MNTFWSKLPKPFLALAPLADVTDPAYRRLISETAAPDVMWTEFVSADGLIRATEEGKKKLMADLLYTEEERPIVAQLFSMYSGLLEKSCATIGRSSSV